MIFFEFSEFWSNLIHNGYFSDQPSVMLFEKVSKSFFKILSEKLQQDTGTLIENHFLEKNLLNFVHNIANKF